MEAVYPYVKLLHIGAVAASGCLFMVRGLAAQLRQAWVMAPPLRYLSYAIDSLLLGAAVALVLLIHQYPFVNAWLTVKVCLLLLYMVLGSLALKRARTAGWRLVCLLAALLTYALIISVAIAHDPLGPFAGR